MLPLTPRGDDGHIGGQRFHGQLKADLVVALAGAAVADGVGASPSWRSPASACGDTGTRGRCPAGISSSYYGVGFQAGPDVVSTNSSSGRGRRQLGRAGLDGLLLRAVQLGALADVAGDCDDLAVVVVFLQPGNDDGGVQTAGVRQNYLLMSFLSFFHDELPSLFLYQDARGMLLAVCLEYLFIHCCILYTLLYILQAVKLPKDSPFSRLF